MITMKTKNTTVRGTLVRYEERLVAFTLQVCVYEHASSGHTNLRSASFLARTVASEPGLITMLMQRGSCVMFLLQGNTMFGHATSSPGAPARLI